MEIVKLELGGGENPKTNFLNIDVIKHEKVDKQCDFEKEPIPFKDNSVEEIFCSHCLEHIENAKFFLNECWRVTKKGGLVKFIVPYGLWEGAQKPVHKQCITECWFDFLRKTNSEKVYGFKRWEIKKIDIKKNKEGKNYEIECILTPNK